LAPASTQDSPAGPCRRAAGYRMGVILTASAFAAPGASSSSRRGRRRRDSQTAHVMTVEPDVSRVVDASNSSQVRRPARVCRPSGSSKSRLYHHSAGQALGHGGCSARHGIGGHLPCPRVRPARCRARWQAATAGVDGCLRQPWPSAPAQSASPPARTPLHLPSSPHQLGRRDGVGAQSVQPRADGRVP